MPFSGEAVATRLFGALKRADKGLSDAGLRVISTPTREAVAEVLEAAFFASVEPDEGEFHTFSLVCVIGGSDTLNEEESRRWDAVGFERVPLNVENLTKLACLSEVGRRFLVVEQDATGIFLSGVATDIDDWIRDDHYLRISVVGPAHIVCDCVTYEYLRYRRGKIVDDMHHPFLLGDRSSYPAVAALCRVTGLDDSALVHTLLQLAREVSKTGHGGMIVLGDTEAGTARHNLARAVKIVDAIDHLQDWQMAIADISWYRRHEHSIDATTSELTDEAIRVETIYGLARDRWKRYRQLVSSMSRVDGAVRIGSDLSLVAFGVKLDAAGLPPVRSHQASGWSDYDPQARGTRHRAAACFAAASPSNLALICSQDGDTSAFLSVDGVVCHLPIPVRALESE